MVLWSLFIESTSEARESKWCLHRCDWRSHPDWKPLSMYTNRLRRFCNWTSLVTQVTPCNFRCLFWCCPTFGRLCKHIFRVKLPPHFGIFCRYENRKNWCIVQQRPSYLHVTLSRRQVTVPIAVILLAASIRCIVEVTRPRELAYLKERKVLRCYCTVDPDEKPRNNWQWSF